MPGNQVSLKDVYDIVNNRMDSVEKRLDDSQTVMYKLREDFMTMEKGRLTRLEGDFRELQGRLTQEDQKRSQNRSTLYWLLVGAGVSLVFSLIQAVISPLIQKTLGG